MCEFDSEETEKEAIDPKTQTEINTIYENYLKAWVNSHGIDVKVELILDEPLLYISQADFEHRIVPQIIMTKNK